MLSCLVYLYNWQKLTSIDIRLSVSDPLGYQVKTAYDPLDEITGITDQAGPTYQSSVTYTFDAGNRLTGATDSISGGITRSYDGLDHLLSETTPEGSVAYTYDADERRQSMTVSGQSAVSYSFDNASRLIAILQASSSVSFGYDSDGRRTSLTLPNGIVATYSYDAASQLTGIVYQGGAMGVGNLAYAYDLAGRRVGVSGSLASTQLPAAVSLATYNADNQLTQWGSTAMSYDLNGNTLNDGTNTYTWNARNRLVSADNNAATFAYDALGRRMSKTVQSGNTSFLYDGVNPVQELNGTTPTANLLTGGIDERFTRTDANGTLNYLTDALGSTIALTDTSGNSQVQYSYEPYGNMNATGSTTNSYTYTGREFDGLGIYYYRARYYDPATERFINEDPMGLRAGPNEYAYVGDSPPNFVDPSGLDKKNPFECASNAASKVSLANGLKALGIGSIPGGGFVADALGGNVFSGATNLITSLGTGQSGEGNDVHSVFYDMGQSVVAGPTQGFGMVAEKIANGFGSTLEDTPWSSSAADIATNTILKGVNGVINSGSEVTTLFGEASTAGFSAAEYASGFGEAKFAYDFLTYAGSFAGCEAGIL